MTLLGNKVTYLYGGNQVKVRLLGWALAQYDWSLLKKRKFKETHTAGMPCEYQGRNYGDVSTSQRMLTNRRKSLPHYPRKEPTLPTSWSCTSSLQNRERKFCLSHSAVGIYSSSPRKPIHLTYIEYIEYIYRITYKAWWLILWWNCTLEYILQWWLFIT